MNHHKNEIFFNIFWKDNGLLWIEFLYIYYIGLGLEEPTSFYMDLNQ